VVTLALLDVNVLLALSWPQHEHYRPASAWFTQHRDQGWATCALTELGFVRISSNRRFAPVPASTQTASAVLQQLKMAGEHHFLNELPGEALKVLYAEAELKHAEVTDWYLAALAQHHGAQLVSFDRGIETALRRNLLNSSNLVLLS